MTSRHDSHPHQLLSAWLDGEIAENERIEVEAHLSACEACRALMDDLRTLARAVRDEPVPAVPAGLASRIEQEISDGSGAGTSTPVAILGGDRWRKHRPESGKMPQGHPRRWLPAWSPLAVGGLIAASLLAFLIVRENPWQQTLTSPAPPVDREASGRFADAQRKTKEAPPPKLNAAGGAGGREMKQTGGSASEGQPAASDEATAPETLRALGYLSNEAIPAEKPAEGESYRKRASGLLQHQGTNPPRATAAPRKVAPEGRDATAFAPAPDGIRTAPGDAGRVKDERAPSPPPAGPLSPGASGHPAAAPAQEVQQPPRPQVREQEDRPAAGSETRELDKAAKRDEVGPPSVAGAVAGGSLNGVRPNQEELRKDADASKLDGAVERVMGPEGKESRLSEAKKDQRAGCSRSVRPFPASLVLRTDDRSRSLRDLQEIARRAGALLSAPSASSRDAGAALEHTDLYTIEVFRARFGELLGRLRKLGFAVKDPIPEPDPDADCVLIDLQVEPPLPK